MDHLNELKRIYPGQWRDISRDLGIAIVNDDHQSIEGILHRFFSTPATAVMLEGEILGISDSYNAPAVLAYNYSEFALQALIRATENPNLRVTTEMLTLLQFAVESGDLSKVRFLVSLGSDPNMATRSADNYFVRTPLAVAIANGRQDIAEELINSSANFSLNEAFAIMNVEDGFSSFNETLLTRNMSVIHERNDITLLHQASVAGNLGNVKWLIDRGVDVNVADNNGRTPLMYAHSEKHSDVVSFLRSCGALETSGSEARDDLQKQINEMERELEIAEAEETRIREEAVPVDITTSIERLELIEDKLGVRFDGICGIQVKRGWNNPVDFLVEVTFDVVGTEDPLKKSFKPTLSAYNATGQLVDTCTTFILNANFLGIESCKLQLLCREEPTRLRLYPANPM